MCRLVSSVPNRRQPVRAFRRIRLFAVMIRLGRGVSRPRRVTVVPISVPALIMLQVKVFVVRIRRLSTRVTRATV